MPEELRELLGPVADVWDRARVRGPKSYAPPQPQPCDKCGEEVVYSPDDTVFLHTRQRIDEWDNRYFCSADYVPRHRVVVACRNCDARYSDVVPLTQHTVNIDSCQMCGASL